MKNSKLQNKMKTKMKTKINNKIKINKMNDIKVNNAKLYGGNIFNNIKEKIFGLNYNEYGSLMGEVLNTENKFILAYEKYTQASRDYFILYNDHVENLKKLEDHNNLTSLVSTFKDLVVPNNFRYKLTIDRSNPLLLTNYLVTDDTLPKNFKREHVINQIRYTLSRFNAGDKILIDSIGNVYIDGITCKFTLKTNSGEKYELETNINEDYIVDLDDVEEKVREIIVQLKGKLDFELELINNFQVDNRQLDIPGITYNSPDDIDLLDAKLKELGDAQNINSIRGKAPEPILNEVNKVKPIEPRRQVYDVYEKAQQAEDEKLRLLEIERKKQEELDREALRDIGMNARLDPENYKIQYPDVASQLKQIFTEPELIDGQNPQAMQQQMQTQQMQLQPNFPNRTFGQQLPMPTFLQQTQPFPLLQPQKNHVEITDQTEAFCRSMSDNPEACKLDRRCFYSANILDPSRKCHKDVKGFPK